MERRFEGKVALVTGATTGIGQATAVRRVSLAIAGGKARPPADIPATGRQSR